MSSFNLLHDQHFFLAKVNRRDSYVDSDARAIMRAGGQTTHDLVKATYLVMEMPANETNVWQCSNNDRPPDRTRPSAMALPELLYTVLRLPHPRLKVVTPEYLDAWLVDGREPRGIDADSWTVSLRGPPRPTSSARPSLKAEPMSSASLNMRPLPQHQAETTPAAGQPLSTLPAPTVFSDVGNCFFYVAPGCYEYLPWLIESMGGKLESSRLAYYVLIPDILCKDKPNLGPLHPSATILDQHFVLDCFKFGAFNHHNLAEWTLDLARFTPKPATLATGGNEIPVQARDYRTAHRAAPAAPIATRPGQNNGLPNFAEMPLGLPWPFAALGAEYGALAPPPQYGDVTRPRNVPQAGPGNHNEPPRADTPQRHTDSPSTSADRHQPENIDAVRVKRNRDEEAVDAPEPTRRRVRFSLEPRWKENIARAVKKEH